MTANDRAQQCESQILSPQPAESTHLMVGTFFILYPATDGCNPGHRARPLPVADKGSATVAQRSKFIGAPSRNEFWEPQEGGAKPCKTKNKAECKQQTTLCFSVTLAPGHSFSYRVKRIKNAIMFLNLTISLS